MSLVVLLLVFYFLRKNSGRAKSKCLHSFVTNGQLNLEVILNHKIHKILHEKNLKLYDFCDV